jgi:hypothetical protein
MLSPALSGSRVRSQKSVRESQHSSETHDAFRSCIEATRGCAGDPQRSSTAPEIQPMLEMSDVGRPSEPVAPPPRLILDPQTEYAKWFDQEQSLPTGPSWKRRSRSRVVVVIPETRSNSASESNGPLSARILGSDIIRANSQGSVKPSIFMKHLSGSARTKSSAFSLVSQDSYLPPSYSPSRVSFGTGRTHYSQRFSREGPRILYEQVATNLPPPHTMLHTISQSTFGEQKDIASSPKLGSSDTTVVHPVFETSLPLSPPPGLISPYALPGSASSRTRHGVTPAGPRPYHPVLDSPRSPPPGL